MRNFLDEETRGLLKAVQRSNREKPTYIKVTVLLLLDKGRSAEEIADDLGIGESTVYRYQSAYLADGLSVYLQTNYQGRWGKLSCVALSQLRQHLNTFLCLDCREIIRWVSTNFGVDYTERGMAKLLDRIGYSYKKTTQVPCEANPERQCAFLNDTLAKILTEVQAAEAVLYYADGVHPTHNTRSTYAWIEKGTQRELPTVSGRDRVNLNAALNALDPTDIEVVEAPRVNAQSTEELYRKLIARHPEATRIYVIQDNARYYRNKHLQQFIQGTSIQQVFLPPYSPNLNLIERLWKFMRKKVIDTHFFRTKELFRQAILQFFEQIHTYQDQLRSLLTLNFHILNSQSLVP